MYGNSTIHTYMFYVNTLYTMKIVIHNTPHQVKIIPKCIEKYFRFVYKTECALNDVFLFDI